MLCGIRCFINYAFIDIREKIERCLELLVTALNKGAQIRLFARKSSPLVIYYYITLY